MCKFARMPLTSASVGTVTSCKLDCGLELKVPVASCKLNKIKAGAGAGSWVKLKLELKLN